MPALNLLNIAIGGYKMMKLPVEIRLGMLIAYILNMNDDDDSCHKYHNSVKLNGNKYVLDIWHFGNDSYVKVDFTIFLDGTDSHFATVVKATGTTEYDEDSDWIYLLKDESVIETSYPRAVMELLV